MESMHTHRNGFVYRMCTTRALALATRPAERYPMVHREWCERVFIPKAQTGNNWGDWEEYREAGSALWRVINSAERQ